MKYIITVLCIGIVFTTYAQEFEISAEIRPRFEYRHGYKTLISDTLNAATFVSQRTRLNLAFGNEKIKTYLSLQNVRVWGEVTSLSLSDNNGTAVHQAWAELLLSKQFSIKLGRQEISYDDQRIFGSVGWAQQARSHDAIVAMFKPNEKHRLDFGLAMNETSETLFETDYLVNNYKSFQYLWYHTNFEAIDLSVLVLNNGLAFEDENEKQKVDYNQTIGSRITYGKNKLKVDASFYFQTGKIANTDLSALNVAGFIQYDINDAYKIGLGAEYLSGTDMNSTENELKSFTPWFGTNHKFNGLMDYFMLGIMEILLDC